ncbi:MAG: hypothetical protein R3B70_33415 [Polyangiaceae bacterium]
MSKPADSQPPVADDTARDSAPPDAEAARDSGAPAPREPADKGMSPAAHLVVGLVLPAVLLLACMWRLREHTVDDAYISYRYAKNLARGWGLVFNEGERIEGYTNFLFTCLLAGAIKLGADPDRAAKVLGGASALGTLACTFAISARLAPLRAVPVLATWLLAGSVVTAGYAVFGLETSFFVFLIVLATWLFLRERERPAAFPWSGAVLGLAGLTRPEAPMFAGLLMIFLAGSPAPEPEPAPEPAPAPPAREPSSPSRKRGSSKPVPPARKRGPLSPLLDLFERRNLVRLALFAIPVAAHLLFRKSYYGEWLPNTFQAKTGNLDQQVTGGVDYLRRYALHTGPFLALALGGVALAITKRRRDLALLATVAASVLAYVVLVGGDWMPYFRFLAVFEPFCFLLAGVFVRWLVEHRGRNLAVLAGLFAVYTAWSRGRAFTEAARAVDDERLFWTSAAGGVADWFHDTGAPRGTIAVADMGYIAYATDYPILDLLGLVDPVISKLPGGYTHKNGPGYVKRVFEVMPRYFVFVGGPDDCSRLPFPAQSRLRADPRFRVRYDLAGQVRHSKGGYWCIFGSRDTPPQ